MLLMNYMPSLHDHAYRFQVAKFGNVSCMTIKLGVYKYLAFQTIF